jgi:hypothetical protein
LLAQTFCAISPFNLASLDLPDFVVGLGGQHRRVSLFLKGIEAQRGIDHRGSF